LDTRKILLVEDNPNDVILTQRMFAKSKIANEIIVVGDGQEAIEYLFEDVNDCKIKNNAYDLPLVILLDLHLPKINGIEILRKLRACEDTKLIPVIVLSTSSEDDEMIASYTLGVISFVHKPVKFIDFADAIRMLGLFLMVTNQQPASLSQ
jgi:two-component system, response regulator